MDLTIPKVPGLKVPKLPDLKISKITIDRRKAVAVAGVAAATLALLLVGWMLLAGYNESQQIAAFSSHVAASEADLALVSGRIAVYMRAPTGDLSVAECDAHVREFAAVAEYGRAVTAHHQRIVAADTVPEAYSGAQSSYLRALDSLNHAFTLWSSAAAAYSALEYSAAERHLAQADAAWREYAAAIGDYDLELRVAQEGEV